MSYDFDRVIDRVGTHSAKWDKMEPLYGVSPEDGIPMWVADMDFAAAPPIQAALDRMRDVGVYGYYADDSGYRAAVGWWMANRHGWEIESDWIFTTHGIVNAVALAMEACTDPGDGVVLMTPVYHAFHRIIKAAGREIVECPLVVNEGRHEMDFEAWDAQMTGSERMLILCSPHNPGGRVWTRAELEDVAAFAKRHDLILVSDEIHQDIVFPGATHIPMALIDGTRDRLITLSATSKTFNIAGCDTGNAIIADPDLRARFGAVQVGLGLSPNAFGLNMVEAAYSPEGADWVDALVANLDENRRILDEGLNAIPGLRSMPLEATYLSWVDFSGTGMDDAEAIRRVQEEARIAVNHGSTFGTGGAGHLRFNFGTRRALVEEAVTRMQDAFSDLQ